MQDNFFRVGANETNPSKRYPEIALRTCAYSNLSGCGAGRVPDVLLQVKFARCAIMGRGIEDEDVGSADGHSVQMPFPKPETPVQDTSAI